MHALQDAVDVDAFWLRRLLVGLVVDGEVVEDILCVFAVHPPETVGHDVADLVGERRVIGHDRRIGRGQQQGVAIFVLQSFAVECRAASRRTEHKAPCHLVHGLPEGITRALEAEHGVEDVDRDHRLAVRGVRRTGSDEGGDGPRFVDALVQDLSVLGLAIVQHEFTVDGDVLLARRVVDACGGEERVHAEGARLVGDDRDETRTDALVAHEVLEQPHEGHRRGNSLLAGATSHDLIVLRPRKR